jgi:non-specific serine/threonine protein kinase
MDQTSDQRAPSVFLSYASANREAALRIADLLEGRGVTVWIDRKSIVGGSSWSGEIVRGIRRCAAFLVVCTPAAVASQNVQQEIQVAFESKRPIIPLLLAETELPESVVYALAGRQWVDLRVSPVETWLPELLRALATLGVGDRVSGVGGPSAGSTTPEARNSSPGSGPPAPSTQNPAPASRHNLPVPLTSFVGREREIAEISVLLGAGPTETRLLTLTGTGGCGKTRLALQVARGRIDAYADGVWLVELAAIADPALVAPTVASVLDVHSAAQQPIQTALIAALRPRRLLLILDNCEHLIDPCAQLADAILRSCPDVQILATSREALGIAGEISRRVPSLAIPPLDLSASFDELAQNECARLFAERARAVSPGFVLTTQNAGAVSQICQRLDGIPLALELAAARLKGLSVEQLAARLDQRFRLLTGGSRAALPRQQTLAAMVGWSYDLLSDPERVLFNRLSVFVGGWTLEAAEAVCGDEEISDPGPGAGTPRADVLDLLLRLVEKSLVIAEPDVDGEDRYKLLETLRQYGLEKLAASGESEAARERHATFYMAFCEQVSSEFFGPRLDYWYTRLRPELDNVRAAIRWEIDTGEVERALRLCGALGAVFYSLGFPSEMGRWFDELLATPSAKSPTVGRGRALASAAYLAFNQLDLDRADRLGDQALATSRAVGDRSGAARSLALKAIAAIERGNYGVAQDLALASLAEEPLIGKFTVNDAPYTALAALEQACFYLGDYQKAQEYLNLDLSSRDWVGWGDIDWRGHLAVATGDYSAARSYYAETMRGRLSVDRKVGVAFTLSGIAGLAAAQGQLDRAVRISGAAARLCELSGVPPQRTQEGYIRGKLPQMRETLGAAVYDAAWEDGQAMTQEQAVAYALEMPIGS